MGVTVPEYRRFQAAANLCNLAVFGAFHPQAEAHLPGSTQTLLLLGPQEPGFWAHVTTAPEFHDGAADPLDRWSRRVISALAARFGGKALFPFTKPYLPFPAWARASGRAWPSPVGLLVHDQAGLLVSYRGAIALPMRMELPPTGQSPCLTCAGQPCRSACPVDAMGRDRYDVTACKRDLKRPGNDCLSRGCAIRRACPVSQTYGRAEAQSAFHMAAFK